MTKKWIYGFVIAVGLSMSPAVQGAEEPLNGWKKEDNTWCYYQNNVRLTNQWQGAYYLKADGKMATSEWIYDPTYQGWYYLRSDGSYLKNAWQKDFYLNGDGKMAMAQWIWDNAYQAWYYVKANGYYARSEWQGAYYLKADGKMAANEWVRDDVLGAWYYLKGNGAYARSEWQGSYYLKSNGKMAVSEFIFDPNYDAWYYLKANGVYAKDETIEGKYIEPDGKVQEEMSEKIRRQLEAELQEQAKDMEKVTLQQAIQWLESDDSLTLSNTYVTNLKAYGADYFNNHQNVTQNVAALKEEVRTLLQKNDVETGYVADTVLPKYNLRNMPDDVKQSLSLYAASLINSVRKQMNTAQVTVTPSSIEMAEKIAKAYIQDGRFISDQKGHDAAAVNRVASEYGLVTSDDNSKEQGRQYYENAVSFDYQNKDYFQMRRDIREAILMFLFNQAEFDHAQSMAGVNFGRPMTVDYFGVGLGASGHFINVTDDLLAAGNTFDTTAISQQVRTNYEAKLIQQLKEHLATLE